jgi:transposase
MCFPPRMVGVIEGLASDWHRLDERIEGLSSEVEELAKRDAGCERLMSVPGIGPIISSAMSPRSGPETASPRVATLFEELAAHGLIRREDPGQGKSHVWTKCPWEEEK